MQRGLRYFVLGTTLNYLRKRGRVHFSEAVSTFIKMNPSPFFLRGKYDYAGGEKIEEAMKVTYEYEGKVYNFCCAMCIDEFKKDPQKYIKKVEEEMQKEQK